MQVKNNKHYSTKLFRLFFNYFFSTLNIVAVALLITSAYSDLVSPNRSVIFAYLGLAFPIILFGNIILFIINIFRRRWKLLCVIILAFSVCFVPFKRYCPLNMPSMPKLDNNVIKLLTYNVMGFGYKNNTKGKKNEIIQYLADSKADIVCLQEYFTNKSSKLMSSQDIATALPMYPYISEIAFNDPKKQNYTYGIAVLSKYPITKTRKLQLNSLYNGAGLFNINIRGKNLTIINNHLESFKLTDEDRSEYAGILTMSGLNNIEVFSGRIQQKLGKAFRIRAKQVELIATEIQKAKKSDACIVACGDFNDTPVSYAHRTLRNVLIDAFAESGYGPGISYNRNFFPFRIDHIMHSDALQAYNCRVDRSINTSDHYPVYCWLRFK